MRILGITSATSTVGAAVADGASVIAECSISGKTAQTEKLIILVDDVLKKSGFKIKDVDAVAVTIGPGSYSGLRGGLATAKGLAASLNIPIVSVPTLHAIAFNFVNAEGTVAVGVNACRDDYNFSLWGINRGAVKRLTADMTVKIDKILEVFSSIRGSITLAADGGLRDKIRNENILLAEPKNVVPWAANVARIGAEKFKAKEFDEYVKITPSYSHKPNIREFGK